MFAKVEKIYDVEKHIRLYEMILLDLYNLKIFIVKSSIAFPLLGDKIKDKVAGSWDDKTVKEVSKLIKETTSKGDLLTEVKIET